MRKRIVITDLTYMWEDQVCIAGADRDGLCIRPVLQDGVKRHHLFRDGRLQVYPRALVELELSPVELTPPHIEDMRFEPDSLTRVVDCNDSQWERVLNMTCFPSIEEMFDGYVEEGRRVKPGANTRSLGTIYGAQVLKIRIDDSYGRRQLRMDFLDPSGKPYNRLPINDLAFRGYFHKTADELGGEAMAEGALQRAIDSADRVYLRIGLARPTQLGNYPEACWTQVTGVYTFPDYLEGKTFADF